MAVLSVAVVLTAQDSASALTAGELKKSCEAITAFAGAGEPDSIKIPETGLPCWYYMAAVQNMSALVDEGHEPLLGVCPPAESTVLDFVRIFVKSVRGKSLSAENNAAAAVLPGLLRAFPCRGAAASRPAAEPPRPLTTKKPA
jgi:hypothetical protein